MVNTENHEQVKFTDIEPILELHHLCLKKLNNLHAHLFSIKELHVASSLGSNIDHPFKRWVFKCFNRLWVSRVSMRIQEIVKNLPDLFQSTIGSPPH
jgi:hypothetical protein